MTSPSLVSRKISDVEDILSSVRFLNEAVFLAACGIGTIEYTNAIQAVCDEIENKLLVVGERLDEIREELK
ncbi:MULTISPECIES: hypothetical protein [Rhizobium]|uniref:Uncharacterized protein n=1 Tax=Rhizobium favelukesii TaxID=348824 RepID=W6R5T3_9HYPH|nr:MULTISPECIES: hypothetical protein [Rhizobium]MCS0462919.1 hypothetical protein [Rhizobium favelukesii]UFS82008.1 hypothetical protein LPB79_27625 [Rhizobium sp. T136]CDM56314.1 hypothetical protein LPU83_0632 [Rhizobium favelukesii]